MAAYNDLGPAGAIAGYNGGNPIYYDPQGPTGFTGQDPSTDYNGPLAPFAANDGSFNGIWFPYNPQFDSPLPQNPLPYNPNPGIIGEPRPGGAVPFQPFAGAGVGSDAMNPDLLSGSFVYPDGSRYRDDNGQWHDGATGGFQPRRPDDPSLLSGPLLLPDGTYRDSNGIWRNPDGSIYTGPAAADGGPPEGSAPRQRHNPGAPYGRAANGEPYRYPPAHGNGHCIAIQGGEGEIYTDSTLLSLVGTNIRMGRPLANSIADVEATHASELTDICAINVVNIDSETGQLLMKGETLVRINSLQELQFLLQDFAGGGPINARIIMGEGGGRDITIVAGTMADTIGELTLISSGDTYMEQSPGTEDNGTLHITANQSIDIDCQSGLFKVQADHYRIAAIGDTESSGIAGAGTVHVKGVENTFIGKDDAFFAQRVEIAGAVYTDVRCMTSDLFLYAGGDVYGGFEGSEFKRLATEDFAFDVYNVHTHFVPTVGVNTHGPNELSQTSHLTVDLKGS